MTGLTSPASRGLKKPHPGLHQTGGPLHKPGACPPTPAFGEEERGGEEVMSHCDDFHGSSYPAASLCFFIFRLHRVGSSTYSPASSNRNEQRAWTHAVSKPGSAPLPPLNHHHEVCSHGPVQALPTPCRTQGDRKVLTEREMEVLISHPSGHTTSWVNWSQSLPLPETQFAPLF